MEEVSTTINQNTGVGQPATVNSIPQAPQENIVVLQFPEVLKRTFRMYFTILSSLTVVVLFLSKHDPELTGIFGLVFFTILLSIITGIIGVIKCFRYGKTLTSGEKIVGWMVSFLILTIIAPLIVFVGLFFLLGYLWGFSNFSNFVGGFIFIAVLITIFSTVIRRARSNNSTSTTGAVKEATPSGTPITPLVANQPATTTSPSVSTTTLPPDSLTPPVSKTNSNRKIISVFFILSTFAYCGYFFTSNPDLATTFTSGDSNPQMPHGKALLKKIANKEIVKDVKSLVALHEKEGLLKDNLAVYRCDVNAGTYRDCVIQEVVKYPESFSRVTNIFGKDTELVYVIDHGTNNYKILKEASAPTFRPLYNGMTESLMGLYAGDDFHLFKGEKMLTIKSVPTGMMDALFYKEYKKGDTDAPERHPYSRMAKGFDGDIQYMGDGEFIYHGDGKASSTDPYIHLTKVEGADLKTFTYYQQKMLGTSYLKYATDKNNIYCDNVSLGSDGYFTSDGLTIIKDPNPKSFKVIYPTDSITQKNAGLQVAKTDTQVFMNCTLNPQIDAATFVMTQEGKVFKDKNSIYYLSVVASGTTQVTIFSTTSLPLSELQETKSQDSNYYTHKDVKEGFRIELPDNFLLKENNTGRDDLIFLANNKNGSQKYSIGVGISVESTSITESEILKVAASGIAGDGFRVERDYTVKKGDKTVRLIETKGALVGSAKELRRVTALYIKNNKLYLVSSVTDAIGWEEYKDLMTRIVLSFVFE